MKTFKIPEPYCNQVHDHAKNRFSFQVYQYSGPYGTVPKGQNEFSIGQQ